MAKTKLEYQDDYLRNDPFARMHVRVLMVVFDRSAWDDESERKIIYSSIMNVPGEFGNAHPPSFADVPRIMKAARKSKEVDFHPTIDEMKRYIMAVDMMYFWFSDEGTEFRTKAKDYCLD